MENLKVVYQFVIFLVLSIYNHKLIIYKFKEIFTNVLKHYFFNVFIQTCVIEWESKTIIERYN